MVAPALGGVSAFAGGAGRPVGRHPVAKARSRTDEMAVLCALPFLLPDTINQKSHAHTPCTVTNWETNRRKSTTIHYIVMEVLSRQSSSFMPGPIVGDAQEAGRNARGHERAFPYHPARKA